MFGAMAVWTRTAMPVVSGLSEDLMVIFWEWSGALSKEFFVVQFVLVRLEFSWQVLYAGKDDLGSCLSCCIIEVVVVAFS